MTARRSLVVSSTILLGCASPPDTLPGAETPPPVDHEVVVMRQPQPNGPLAIDLSRVSPALPPSRPGADFPAVTGNGAWCWFADPRALRFQGSFDKTYLGWINNTGEVAIASFEHTTRRTTIALIKTLSNDDHDNPALLLLPDGRLAAFYSHHCGSAMYYRITTEPEEITSWGPERKVPVNSPGTQGYTYPNPSVLAAENDRIFLFWRGAGWLPTYSTSETGDDWSPARILVDTEGKNRPYVKYVSDGQSRIHFAFTDAHPIKVANNNVYYAYYEQGSFYRADGSLIGTEEDLPLTPAVVDTIYDANEQPGDPIPAWVWDIAIDDDGGPVVVYATFVSTTDHRYHYARWTGTAWNSQELVAGGPSIAGPEEPYYSGGIVLDHDDINTVYLSKQQQERVHEIERWTFDPTSQHWGTLAITNNSSQKNVRPLVVRNHGGGPMQLLWMHGEYAYYYKEYDTSLRFYPGTN